MDKIYGLSASSQLIRFRQKAHLPYALKPPDTEVHPVYLKRSVSSQTYHTDISQRLLEHVQMQDPPSE